MKKAMLMVAAVLCTMVATAQTATDSVDSVAKDSVVLKEVEVKASRVVPRTDGMTIFPSEVQLLHSASGYSLLGKLSLPNIRVDEVKRTISALDMKGAVQLRINGVVASVQDVQTLDVASVTRVDYINSPGVRYGTDVAYVIDIRTRKKDAGGRVGYDLSNALTTRNGANDVYASVSRGKSQFSLMYEQDYANQKSSDYRESAQYLVSDGTERHISRQRLDGKNVSYGHLVNLKYNLADSASYVFQASLTASVVKQPRTTSHYLFSEESFSGQTAIAEPISMTTCQSSKENNFTPTLDLYFFHQIGKHQSVTADLLGTYIRTRSDNYNDEGDAYSYQTVGNTYSLIGEAIYENRLKPFTFSAGVNVNWKYMDNIYRGSVESANGIHTSGIYGFAEIKGYLAKLDYTAGFGLSNQLYRQGENEYNYWLCRPKLSLSYPLSQIFQLRYVSELSQHISQVAMISETRIRQNSMEWTVGNPALKPSSRWENSLALVFRKPRVSSVLGVTYRNNHHCNLAKYTRTADNQFLYTMANQRHCNMLYANNYTRIDIQPEHLSLTVNGGIYRFFNRGDNYNHIYTAYNYGASLQGYWGRWTVGMSVDNGWKFMEGETIGHQGMHLDVSVAYHVGDFDLTLYMQNPFLAHPKSYSSKLVNEFLHKQMVNRSNSDGNLVMLGVAWNINRGKEYRKIEKSIQNKDRETGILK